MCAICIWIYMKKKTHKDVNGLSKWVTYAISKPIWI